MSGPDFYAARLTAFRPGEVSGASTYPWSSDAWSAPPQSPFETEATVTFRASDSGYRTEYAGGDVTVYPAVLERTVDLDRQITLAPGSAASSVSWGTLRLINADGRWDGVSTSFSCDGRPLELLYGQRAYDQGRGLYLDPASSGLTTLFRGLAQGWRLAETVLEIPLRDASYWLGQPYQRGIYSGAGGLSGDASVAGQTLPRARGGTVANPIRQVTPLLIDAVNRIYQYTDGPGLLVNLFENGALGFTNGGDVADLYSGSTASGAYRTSNGNGLFQLGSAAAGTITADVVGYFPTAGALSQARDLARYVLTEDMGLPADLVDTASFTALPSGSVSGWYWPSGDGSTGADAVSVFLRGLGAKLLPGRDGKLRALALRALPAAAMAERALTAAQIIDLKPNVLPAPLDPPAFRWRVGFARTHTVQTSGLSPLLPADQRRSLGQEWPVAYWLDTGVASAYAAPSDPELVPTALLVGNDALTLANAIGALWSLRRRLYDVTVPVEVGMTLDIGDVVSITYPFGDLRQGQTGQIVSDQLRGNDATITLQVLV